MKPIHLLLGIIALVVVAGASVGITLAATAPSDQLGPGKFLGTHITATPTDPHLTAFQNALNGEGIDVNDTVATQWGTVACAPSGHSVNQAELALSSSAAIGRITVPEGQIANIAQTALDFYCPA